MPDPAIIVDNVSKRYVVGELATAGDLRRWATAPLRAMGLIGRNQDAAADAGSIRDRRIGRHAFYALRDVSFEVQRGEVLGIIGHNGAGKSTLLKVLSRITAPTRGRVGMSGRFASLLEVGTGFHPELTGRENVYLNGSILGMGRAEIDAKFDEIVGFAGVEEFIDTPIKRYSSGMKVRLGFAVAAHLEPEILIVDEVLAVGDASFQRKCIGKMNDVANSGRTVLLVSHNMVSIASLANRAILLSHGRVAAEGPAQEVIDAFSEQQLGGASRGGRRPVRDDATVTVVAVEVAPGRHGAATLTMGEDLAIDVELASAASQSVNVGVSIETLTRERILSAYTGRDAHAVDLGPGNHRVRVRFPAATLSPGSYVVSAGVRTAADEAIDAYDGAASFEVVGADLTGTGHPVRSADGKVWLPRQWELDAAQPGGLAAGEAAASEAAA